MNHNELKYKLLVKRKTNVFYSGLNANTTKSLFRVGMMLCGSVAGMYCYCLFQPIQPCMAHIRMGRGGYRHFTNITKHYPKPLYFIYFGIFTCSLK